MKKVLITGANGLIGYDLVKELSQKNRVYTLSRNKTDLVSENIKHIHCDFSDDWLDTELPQKIDVIYHLAQSEHFREFPERSMDVFDVNTRSTLKLLEYARKSGCNQFIYASSGGVYGNSDEEFMEDEPLLNRGDLGFYLSTKFCSELLAENYTNFFDVIITRFFFVYGERQNKSMLIPRLVENVKAGNLITIQGHEGLKINPVYVEDAVSALKEILNLRGSHKINIGGREVLSLKQICDIIGGMLEVAPNYSYSDASPKHLIGDISKMTALLTSPNYTFYDGVKKLIVNK